MPTGYWIFDANSFQEVEVLGASRDLTSKIFISMMVSEDCRATNLTKDDIEEAIQAISALKVHQLP